MMGEKIIKEVTRTSGGGDRYGNKYSYGLMTFPRDFIGKYLIFREATKEEILKHGITIRQSVESNKRIKVRKDLLEAHLVKLRKLREARIHEIQTSRHR